MEISCTINKMNDKIERIEAAISKMFYKEADKTKQDESHAEDKNSYNEE
jgi:hypothetical protein